MFIFSQIYELSALSVSPIKEYSVSDSPCELPYKFYLRDIINWTAISANILTEWIKAVYGDDTTVGIIDDCLTWFMDLKKIHSKSFYMATWL